MQRSTSQRKSLLYMVLARAATAFKQLSAFWPLYTHSVPTLSILIKTRWRMVMLMIKWWIMI